MDKIVLLDDTTVLRQRIEQVINSTGHNQVESYNQRHYELSREDVIYKDAKLLIVDADGIKLNWRNLVQDLRQKDYSRTLPIILVTANVSLNMIIDVSKYDKVDILQKPFNDMKLIEKVLWNQPAPTLEHVVNQEETQVSGGSNDRVKLVWSNDFMIGIDQIDREHKLIIDHFTKLYELMREGKGHTYYHELMTFLISYIDTHFSNEEKYHKEVAYPGIKEHIKAHRVFTNKIRSLVESSKDKTVSDQDLININIFIKQWLLHHILVEDMKVANYVNDDK